MVVVESDHEALEHAATHVIGERIDTARATLVQAEFGQRRSNRQTIELQVVAMEHEATCRAADTPAGQRLDTVLLAFAQMIFLGERTGQRQRGSRAGVDTEAAWNTVV